jgi:hypothetical protein
LPLCRGYQYNFDYKDTWVVTFLFYEFQI